MLPAFVTPFLFLLVISYLTLVRLLRYRRADASFSSLSISSSPSSSSSSNLPASSWFPFHSSGSMDFVKSQDLVLQLMEFEFPLIYRLSLQYSLFRTYGVPSISSLLCETGRLSTRAGAPKRYTDTEALIMEFVRQRWGSKEWTESLGRVNSIHKEYQDKGKISNDDLLFTLSLFALEPIRWIGRWEWREMTLAEKEASGVFWKGVGEAMGIDYSALKSNEETTVDEDGDQQKDTKKAQKWNNGIEWCKSLEQWSLDYEARCMIPAKANHMVAERTIAILLWTVPVSLKPLGEKFVITLMDERLRIAMEYPSVSASYHAISTGLFRLRQFALRHFMLPRWIPFKRYTQERDPTTGLYHLTTYDAEPYYVRPNWSNRWGSLDALLRRWSGLSLPGDQPEKFCVNGYEIRDLGPSVGKKWQKEMEEKVGEVGKRRCPMGFS